MKAILVIDVPNTEEYTINYDIYKKGELQDDMIYCNQKLKKVPDYIRHAYLDDEDEAFAEGFNQCLDEILDN